mmetsp:Transcript_43257/g.105862  ORF Transcript_43257/g.105862 Transcript_43257/m.105862 type:complete len:377 (-) Transcript_43257:19-1149(-)
MVSAQTKRLSRLTALLVPLVILSLVGITRKVQKVRRKLDMQHELERVSDVLLGWVGSNGGYVGPIKLGYFDHKQSRDPVRGIMATADIQPGTTLFKIPRKLLVIPELRDDLQEQEFLLSTRIAEELQRLHEGGGRTAHTVYFKSLPSSSLLQMTHPMFADNEDLALFSDLSVVKAVREARKRLKSLHSRLGDKVSWDEFLVSFVLQNSRRFIFGISNPTHKALRTQALCLVPLLDFVNFPDREGGENMEWAWDANQDAVVVKASKPIPAGGELLLHPFSTDERPKHNGLLTYQYGVTLKGNEITIKQLPNDMCEGMESAVEELHADRDKRHWMRTALAELTHESCSAVHTAREREKERRFLEAEAKRTQLMTANIR